MPLHEGDSEMLNTACHYILNLFGVFIMLYRMTVATKRFQIGFCVIFSISIFMMTDQSNGIVEAAPFAAQSSESSFCGYKGYLSVGFPVGSVGVSSTLPATKSSKTTLKFGASSYYFLTSNTWTTLYTGERAIYLTPATEFISRVDFPAGFTEAFFDRICISASLGAVNLSLSPYSIFTLEDVGTDFTFIHARRIS